MCTNILEVDKSLRPLEISIPGYQGLVVDIRRLHYHQVATPTTYSFELHLWAQLLQKSVSPKEPISTFEHTWKELASERTP